MEQRQMTIFAFIKITLLTGEYGYVYFIFHVKSSNNSVMWFF